MSTLHRMDCAIGRRSGGCVYKRIDGGDGGRGGVRGYDARGLELTELDQRRFRDKVPGNDHRHDPCIQLQTIPR